MTASTSVTNGIREQMVQDQSEISPVVPSISGGVGEATCEEVN